MARASPRAHLMQLPVPALDAEAAAIGRANRLWATVSDAVDSIGVILQAAFLLLRSPLRFAPGVVTSNHNIRAIGMLRRLIECVAHVTTRSSDAQLADAVYATALRQRDDIRDVTGAQVTKDFDCAEGFVPVGAFETRIESMRTRDQSFDDFHHLFAFAHQRHGQRHTLAFANDGERRIGVKARRARFGLVGADIFVLLTVFAVVRDVDPIAGRFPGARLELSAHSLRQLRLQSSIELIFQLLKRLIVISQSFDQMGADGIARWRLIEDATRTFDVTLLNRCVAKNLPELLIIEVTSREF